MPSIAQRASILAIGAASLALPATPAWAQDERSAVLNVLVECARIDDPTARLACYDNNMTRAGATARTTIPGQVRGVVGGAAPIRGQDGPAGFGADDVRSESPDRFRAPASQLDEITARVRAIRQRQPGIYLVTLEDGAEWMFAEEVGLSYRLPRAGSIIEIERGSLGSYLMGYDGQRVVPVTRVR